MGCRVCRGVDERLCLCLLDMAAESRDEHE
jgi:hypothetical protein